jgi:drug/metabolite transporter (DMT)-like permease
MFKPWILLAVALALDTMGTVLFKHGTNQFEPSTQGGWKSNLENIGKALAQKQIALGLIAYALEYVVWLAYISTTPLNVAFSLSSLNVILVLFASRLFLGEQVTKRRYIGALFILAGVFLVGGTA